MKLAPRAVEKGDNEFSHNNFLSLCILLNFNYDTIKMIPFPQNVNVEIFSLMTELIVLFI